MRVIFQDLIDDVSRRIALNVNAKENVIANNH